MKQQRNGSGGAIISAAAIIGVASLASRLLGLVRERVFTITFGAGDTFDAFVAAFRLPDLIFNLVVVGALSAAFIPLFTEKLVNGKKSTRPTTAGRGSLAQRRVAFDFASAILNQVLIAVVGLSLLYVAAADFLVPLITPGFTGDKLEMTIQLSRVMALQPLLLSVSFVFSGILNSLKRFVAYALAPLLYNAGIIVGAVYFYPIVGVPGLGWGVVLGAALHMLIQLPSVLRVGYRWQAIVHWSNKDATALRRMIIPRMFGLAGQQVNLFLVTIIGSTLTAGSITVFHLANNVQSLPIGMFGLAFAQAAFPTLAEQVAQKEHQQFLNTLTKSFRYILFFIIPLSLWFFLLRAQMIRVLFGAGQFDWEDTILTYETFGVLLMSLFAQATIPLLARAFYVRQNTAIPVTISLVSIVINVVLALLLAPSMGIQGLALAFSVAAIVQLVLLLATLHWQLGGFNDLEVITSIAKVTLAALLAAVVLQALKYPLARLVDMDRGWGVLVQMSGSFSGGMAAYLWLCLLFQCDELAALQKYLPRRRKKLQLPPATETPRFGGLPE